MGITHHVHYEFMTGCGILEIHAGVGAAELA